MTNQEIFEKLAGSLPYKTKTINWHEGEKIISELTANNIANFIDGTTKAKLLLRPLSDLTKPITVEGYNNGEPFVPVVEIGNIFKLKLEPLDSEGEIEYGFTQKYFDDHEGYAFGYWEDGKFGVWMDCIDGNPITTECSYSAIQLLYRWHFDIHNLIESGHAVNINEI